MADGGEATEQESGGGGRILGIIGGLVIGVSLLFRLSQMMSEPAGRP